MRNIHLLPTEKRSRLILQGTELLLSKYMEVNEGFSEFNQYLYITNDEEIKVGDWCIYHSGEVIKYLVKVNTDNLKKIILTTDQDLIADGVQAIDDEFLTWFVKNPTCEFVEVEDWYNKFLSCCRSKEECYCNKKRIIIPSEPNPFELPKVLPDDVFYESLEEPKQETLEEAAFKLFPRLILDPYNPMEDDNKEYRNIWIEGAKWQAERMYSEEDMMKAVRFGELYKTESSKSLFKKKGKTPSQILVEWFQEFKKIKQK
jgi:hypothetical protein